MAPGGDALDVMEYAAVIGLDANSTQWLTAFMANWKILRQCCGHESSKKWRLELHGVEPKLEAYATPAFPNCRNYNLSHVEKITTRIVSSPRFGDSMRQEMSMYTGSYCATSNAKVAGGDDSQWNTWKAVVQAALSDK